MNNERLKSTYHPKNIFELNMFQDTFLDIIKKSWKRGNFLQKSFLNKKNVTQNTQKTVFFPENFYPWYDFILLNFIC